MHECILSGVGNATVVDDATAAATAAAADTVAVIAADDSILRIADVHTSNVIKGDDAIMNMVDKHLRIYTHTDMYIQIGTSLHRKNHECCSALCCMYIQILRSTSM